MLHTINKFSSHPEGMLDRDQRTIFILQTKSNELLSTCCCDDCKPKYFDIRKRYLNSNVNCDHLHNNHFRKKKITRFFQKLNKYLLAFFCIWILTSQHFQPKTVMSMPVLTSFEYNKHPTIPDIDTLKTHLMNPCGYKAEVSDTIDGSGPAFQLENKDVKFYLGKIESSAKTGLSDFKTGYLKYFLSIDFNVVDQDLVRHHEEWKHESNPNLLPNGKLLEIEFLKGISEDAKRSAIESARSFDVANDSDKQQLLAILTDCDERLQRLMIVFYQMHKNLNNYDVNFRPDLATENMRKVYDKALAVIRTGLCDVRTAMYKLYGIRGMEKQPARMVDVDDILNNPFKTDSIGDWVNLRQLHDQLEYMTHIFGIWANEIQEIK